MVQINFARRELVCKVVYYGPGLGGKTTNLQMIHGKLPSESRGSLTSIATEQERTLFFDFLPLDLGTVSGMKTKFMLYTVPGQVYYNSLRKQVVNGADGIAFVADSDPRRVQDNIESMKNLEENLRDFGIDIRKIPFVIQFNKRDLPEASPVEEMSRALNPYQVPVFEAVATRGDGVMPTLKTLSKLVIERLNEDYAVQKTPSLEVATVQAVASKSAGPVVPARTEAAPAAKISSGELPKAVPVGPRPAPIPRVAAPPARSSQGAPRPVPLARSRGKPSSKVWMWIGILVFALIVLSGGALLFLGII